MLGVSAELLAPERVRGFGCAHRCCVSHQGQLALATAYYAPDGYP